MLRRGIMNTLYLVGFITMAVLISGCDDEQETYFRARVRNGDIKLSTNVTRDEIDSLIDSEMCGYRKYQANKRASCLDDMCGE